MSSFEDFLSGLREEGINAKYITGSQLSALLSGDARVLADVLGVEDCGRDECSIHGKISASNADERIINTDDLQAMTADEMEQLALSLTAGAHNFLVKRKYDRALILQKQAELWRQAAFEERNRRAGVKLQEFNAANPPKVDNSEVRADEAEPVA